MKATAFLLVPFALLTVVRPVSGGLIAYGVCQTGCNALAVACYGAAGATFGTVVASALAPAAILACNAGLGTCSSACATVALLAPTP
ncbi:unnamed protein product [Somion occarium]|uniref:Cysteine-rich protein n=1 Tax=Somion occarium TaxID=3059160 RepID=A0ABP1DR63_9APHY